MMNIADYALRYFEQDVPTELLCWMGYIFIPIIATMILGCSSFIYGIFSVSIYFWNLIWHPNSWSVIDILQNPEGNGRLIPYNNQHHCYCRREQACPVPRWVWRWKPCQLNICWSTLNPKDKTVIQGYDSRLCKFTCYQIHPMSINKTNGASSSEDGVTADVNTTTNSWKQCVISRFLPTLKIIGKAQPRNPPNGCILPFLVLLATIGIIAILTSMKCHHSLNVEPSAASNRVADCILLPSKGDDNFNCWSMHYKGDYLFHSKGGYDQDLQHSLDSLSGYTTSFADADSEKINTQIHFNTDSIFFVWNNSTTGYVCNDVRKFIPGSPWQSNKHKLNYSKRDRTMSSRRNGSTSTIWWQRNETHIYSWQLSLSSKLAGDLLSTRQLAEKFTDSNGNLDNQTRIKSRYSSHVLNWCFGNYRKTFPTPTSGLPELLFDEGFHEYNSFCMQVSSFLTTN